MRILITNNTLAGRAGSELYVRDLAIELMRRGHHPVAYSTTLGAVAEELRNATIPVIDHLGALGAKPDIIHGHHHLEAVTAMLHFPDVPAIHYCHGWVPWQEVPLDSPQILRYVAVSQLCRERLIAEAGIAPERVEVMGNFFDERRFAPRPPLPRKPRRVLAFGNDFSEHKGLAQIREACARLNLEFDAAGMSVGESEADPGARLARYDIVFAKGRAAIEGLAVGNAVVLCNSDNLGPLVTRANFKANRDLNFGMRAIPKPLVANSVVEQLSLYDADEAAAVSQLARENCGLQPAVDRIVALYCAVLDEARSRPAPCIREMARAAGDYLEHWAPSYKRAVNDPHELQRWRERCLAAESILASLQREHQRLTDRYYEAESEKNAVQERLNHLESLLEDIRTSATWRWSRNVLESPIVQRVFGRGIKQVAARARSNGKLHTDRNA